MNLTIFLLSYVLIVFSVLGYGLLFQNVFKKTIDLNFEYSFLGALFFLIFLSYATHFFISHNYFHNLIIFILGLIFFLIFFFKKKKILTQYSKIIFSIFGILIVAFLTAKTHDDFPYYHFPYTYYLTQAKLIIGIGNLNHGFRTPSSIFYLNSLFYLPFVKFYFFQLGAILLLGASNLILIFKMKNDYENKTYDFIFFLTLLSFLFINIFFYRISEHGTDRTAQILIFILLIEVLTLFRNTILLEKFFTKVFILLGLIISLKAFYTLYLLLLFPIFFYLRKVNFKFLSKIFLKNLYFYIFTLFGIFLILVNIFNSGCVLYPISFTCFANLDWSLYQEANLMNDWYEQWSKGGAGPNFRVEDPENYIKGFNWVQNWIDVYFFNKVSDFLAGLFFLLIIFFLIFYSKNKKKINNNNILWIYFTLIILLFEWFYNHPSLRYGGYSLISLVIFIPFSTFISKFTFNKYLKKKIIFLILISLIIFTGRNINRINKEIKKYNYDLISSPTYIVKKNHFRIDLFINKLIEKYENCDNANKINCDTYEGISIDMKKNYYYLTKNK
jgi:hypothetical protein